MCEQFESSWPAEDLGGILWVNDFVYFLFQLKVSHCLNLMCSGYIQQNFKCKLKGVLQEVLKHHYLLPREKFHQSEENLYGIDFKF